MYALEETARFKADTHESAFARLGEQSTAPWIVTYQFRHFCNEGFDELNSSLQSPGCHTLRSRITYPLYLPPTVHRTLYMMPAKAAVSRPLPTMTCMMRRRILIAECASFAFSGNQA